jgi:hypothetical protein
MGLDHFADISKECQGGEGGKGRGEKERAIDVVGIKTERFFVGESVAAALFNDEYNGGDLNEKLEDRRERGEENI